jgi:hypothetical protein
MRLFLLLQLFFPLALIAQTSIFISVTTYDDKGKILPYCNLELSFPDDTATIVFKSDRTGYATTTATVNSQLLLTGDCAGFYAEGKELNQLEKLKANDTVSIDLIFKPHISIINGINEIAFDTVYASREIADLKDEIILFTNRNQIAPKDNYTMLAKTNLNNYRLVYFSEMIKGGPVDPIKYKSDLKMKFNKMDEVQLMFRHKTKRYYIRGIKVKDQFYYELNKR